MPLVEDYRAALDSPVADLANVAAATAPAAAPSRRAVPARVRRRPGVGAPRHRRRGPRSRRRRGDTKGATGFGVRLLLRWLGWLSRPSARPLDGRQQPVTDGQQQRHQALVLRGPARASSRMATVSGSRWAGSATRSSQQRVVERHHAAGAQQPQRAVEVVQALQPVGVAEHQVVAAVGEAGQDVEGAAADEAGPVAPRRRPRGTPARASCWRSGSKSTVVRTPSGRMPRSS